MELRTVYPIGSNSIFIFIKSNITLPTLVFMLKTLLILAYPLIGMIK